MSTGLEALKERPVPLVTLLLTFMFTIARKDRYGLAFPSMDPGNEHVALNVVLTHLYLFSRCFAIMANSCFN